MQCRCLFALGLLLTWTSESSNSKTYANNAVLLKETYLATADLLTIYQLGCTAV